MELSLYHIEEKKAELIGLLFDPETGEINETIEKELDDLMQSRDEKIRRCIAYVKNKRANAKALKEESDALAKRAKAFANSADKTEAYLGDLTDKKEDAGFECTEGKLSWRESKRTIIDNPSKLPAGMFIIERKPIAKEIKLALENGSDDVKKSLEGVAHIETNTNFKIK